MALGGIQTQVNTQPAVGIVGDFASANPRYSVDAGPGGIVAGPSGLTIGLFAWLNFPGDGDNSPSQANNYASGGWASGNAGTNAGAVAGFVGRAQQGLITAYLASSGLVIPAGFQATLYSGGDFWIVNANASTPAFPGNKAYAAFTTGKATFAAAGAPTTTTQTTATIAAGTAATFTGSIQGTILTITGTVTNTLYLGALLSGTSVVTGTQIVSQLTGTTGAAGTYAVNIGDQLVPAGTSLTATPYIANGTGGSGITVGSVLTATSTGSSGVVVGAVVTALATTGANVVVAMPYPGTGTNTTATLTFSENVETSWYCRSYGNAGEIVKISNVPALG